MSETVLAARVVRAVSVGVVAALIVSRVAQWLTNEREAPCELGDYWKNLQSGKGRYDFPMGSALRGDCCRYT
jgi:hypothetical protein